MTPTKVIIVVVLLSATTALVYLVYRYLSRQEELRSRRLNKLTSFDPINVPEELGDTLEEVRSKAKTGVARRFTIIRRTTIILLLLTGLTLSSLPLLGFVSGTAVSLVAGILSVMVGIAARPFLENFISGIVISLSSKLRVGDTIYIDGELGTVEDITVTHTTIKIWNWQRYILPNSMMLNKTIRNCSHSENLLWTHVEFQVSYEQDIDELEGWLQEKVSQSEYFSGNGQAELWPMELGDRGIRYWLAAWAKGPEAAWYLRNDMRRAVIKLFKSKGITAHLQRVQLQDDRKKETEDDHFNKNDV